MTVRAEVSRRATVTQMFASPQTSIASQGRSYGLGIAMHSISFTEAQLDSELFAFSVCFNGVFLCKQDLNKAYTTLSGRNNMVSLCQI